MKRLHLGLTDIERRQMAERRRVRNCFIALAVCILIVGFIEKHV